MTFVPAATTTGGGGGGGAGVAAGAGADVLEEVVAFPPLEALLPLGLCVAEFPELSVALLLQATSVDNKTIVSGQDKRVRMVSSSYRRNFPKCKTL